MTNAPSRWIAIPALLALATMLGCQGISVGGKSSTLPASTQTGTFTVSPASIDFGTVQTGTSQSQTDVVTNTGSSTVTVTQATVTGTGFSTTGLTLPLTLSPQQSLSFQVVFSPTAAGSASGSLAVAGGSSVSVNVALSGTGAVPGSLPAASLTISPSNLVFGNVPIGSNQTQAETVTNTGSQNLTISAAAIHAPFAVTGLTLPLNLAPNQSSTFGIGFTPSVSGAATGTLSMTVSGSSTPVGVVVSGSGVTPGVLTASTTTLTFTNVQVGQNQSQTETVQNTGSSNVTISATTVSGTGFALSGIATPLTLTPGQSASFSVTLTPPSAGNFSGSVSIDSNASDPSLTTVLSGTAVTPATLTATPASLTFSNVVIGQSQTQTETVKNTGGGNATISAAAVSGTGFSISGISAPLTLAPGQSASFSVTLTPSSSGNFTGSVSLTSNASNPALSVPLSGTAVPLGTLTATPPSFSFTNIVVGQNQTQTETLKNTGGSNITISAATESGSGFSISGITAPLTLTPGQSTSFSVTFTPPSANTFNGTISITSNASNPSLTMSLSGTGVAPATLTATPSSLTFTTVVVGQSQTQTETVMNTGGVSATISAAAVSGTGFSLSGISTPLTLNPGQVCTQCHVHAAIGEYFQR